MKQQAYYHISNMRDLGFQMDSDWYWKEGRKYFCEICGLRLETVTVVPIHVDTENIPSQYLLGAEGLQNIGYASDRLLQTFGLQLEKYFWFGEIYGSSGLLIPDWKTFTAKNKRIPIRSHRPMTCDRCKKCHRVGLASFGGNRYVVLKGSLTLPIYESHEAQFVLREDVFLRIKPILTKYVQIEKLAFEKTPHDGRTESELEWYGD